MHRLKFDAAMVEVFRAVLGNRAEVSLSELLCELDIPDNRSHRIRGGKILRKLGWKVIHRNHGNGCRERVYVRKK